MTFAPATSNFDYIIIGSGSAGSAIAYRLAESGQTSIAVIEFGGSDAGPFIQMPAALSYPMNMPFYDWGYRAEAENGLNGRSLVCPRGKVIGGSSSINGMIYVRGNPLDYDHWRDQGAAGWGYVDVLPYFRRMETSHGGQAPWRGTDGPLHITRGPRDNPLHEAFVTAATQAGYAATLDYNGHRQEGFGPADMTVWNGRRWSAANAYLRPALKTGRVKLYSRTLADRILFDGRKAIGVRVTRKGKKMDILAEKAVILSAGAIASPAILQRSGVGDAVLLQKHDIEVIADRKGVGTNLQDHLEIYFQVACSQPITLYKHLNFFSKALIGTRWLMFKSGLGASNQFETLGFIRSDKAIAYPDIQFHFLPVAIRYDGKAPAAGHGFQLHVGPMRSKSRGHVKITSASPEHAPEIRFNYLSHPDDLTNFRKALHLSREILAQPAMAPFYDYEIQPGAEAQSDEQLDDFIRNKAESAYHPCGTCRIGRETDPFAVVNPDCQVIGTENLFCADSSLFPRITNGNLNAPSIMVGEKAADHILGCASLPSVNDSPFIHPHWQTQQR
jgi:choline dehydrogenase